MKHPRAEAVWGGVATGIAGGLFGVGGGLVVIPLLTWRFKLTQHQAHGTSLAIVGATALISVVIYAVHGNVDWRTAVIVGLASMMAARWGARLAARTSAAGLTRAFSILLVAVALRLLLKGPAAAAGPPHASLAVALVVDIAIGLAVGLLAGYMGVGGGVIAVPAFTLLLGMTQHAAQGTSLAVILLTAPAGALEHHRLGSVIWRWVPPFAIGAMVTAPLASILAQRLPQVALGRMFAVFLLVNAVNFWLRAGRKRKDFPA